MPKNSKPSKEEPTWLLFLGPGLMFAGWVVTLFGAALTPETQKKLKSNARRERLRHAKPANEKPI